LKEFIIAGSLGQERWSSPKSGEPILAGMLSKKDDNRCMQVIKWIINDDEVLYTTPFGWILLMNATALLTLVCCGHLEK